MKVFLSWSGSRSRAVAEAFAWWLPKMIQSLDPLLSSEIDKGARWSTEISAHLETSRVGIICLTADNLPAPWILFEAGAMSKTKDAHVITFLLDISPASVEPPLGQFQHTVWDKDDIRKLLRAINRQVASAGERAPAEGELDESYEVWWPKLEERLRAASEGTRPAVHHRDNREVLEEVLEIVRQLHRKPDVTSASISARHKIGSEAFDRGYYVYLNTSALMAVLPGREQQLRLLVDSLDAVVKFVKDEETYTVFRVVTAYRSTMITKALREFGFHDHKIQKLRREWRPLDERAG